MDQDHRLHDTSPISISQIECSVLECIRLEGGLITLDEIGTLANAIRRHQPGDDTDYAVAVASCLACGWIKIITEQDQREDTARWANEPHQTLSEVPYRIGSLDFTPMGWQVYTSLLEEKHGVTYEAQYAEYEQCLWDVPGWVSLLSVSADALVRQRDEIFAGDDNLTGDSLRVRHTLGEVVGPYSIGPWWVNRFYRAHAGYRLDIAFSPADLHTEAE